MTCDWEWESFERVLTIGSFTIVNFGPLWAPIRSFSITRDEKLQLIMETRAEQTATSYATPYPLGTVRVNTDTVTLSNRMGIEMVAGGVQSHGWKTSFYGDPTLCELREECSVHNLKGIINPHQDPKYVIDWLANVDDSFIWPDVSDDETQITKTRSLRGGNNGPVLRAEQKHTGGSRNCAKLSIEGFELYLCTAKSAAAKGVSKPGCILYIGTPPDDFRDKIRRCLSFSLGTYLVYLGCSSFCDNWSLSSFEAISAYSLGGKAFDLPPSPPSPLGTRYEREINPELLSRMVNSLYSHYDALHFGPLSWAYWHAMCATPHIAAVHFGAVIEALQRSYLKANKGVLKTKLVEEKEWERMKAPVASVESSISGLATDDDVKTLIKNKLHDLNTKPPRLITESLLNLLQLELGERERKAWKRRNVAAHGGSDEAKEVVDLVRDIKLLRLRFHRMLLSITKASDLYYDYFSLGHPTRKLTEPVP